MLRLASDLTSSTPDDPTKNIIKALNDNNITNGPDVATAIANKLPGSTPDTLLVSLSKTEWEFLIVVSDPEPTGKAYVLVPMWYRLDGNFPHGQHKYVLQNKQDWYVILTGKLGII